MRKNEDRPGYKKTEAGWIPEDWGAQHLGELVRICTGKKDVNEGNSDGKYPFFTCAETHTYSDVYSFDCEALLVAGNANVGRTNYYRGKFEAYQRTYVLSSFSRIVPQYLYQYLRLRLESRLQSATHKSAMAYIKLAYLESFPIGCPSLSEQEAIVEVLGCWDKAILNYERKIEKKRNIKKGLMQRLLSGKQRLPGFSGEWKEVRLEDVCEVTMGQSPPSSSYNEKREGLPLLQGNNDIENGVSCPRFWTTQPTKRCLSGDILMSVRAPVGEIAVSIHEACIGRGICAIRAKKADHRFVFHLLRNSERAWQAYGQGSTFTAVNSKDVKHFQMEVPSDIKEQAAIADALSNADNEISGLEHKLALLREQKKYLLNNLVTGTIRLPEFENAAESVETNGDNS